jgi:hypothetical protein
MTVSELAAVVGRLGVYTHAALRIEVQVIDVRQVWGRVDYLIRPVAGSGSQWVASDSIQLGK